MLPAVPLLEIKHFHWCKTVAVFKYYRRGFDSYLGAFAEDWELIFHASTRGNKPSVYPSAGPATVKLYFPHDASFVSMRLDTEMPRVFHVLPLSSKLETSVISGES